MNPTAKSNISSFQKRIDDAFSPLDQKKSGNVILQEGITALCFSAIPLLSGGIPTAYAILTSESSLGSYLTLSGSTLSLIGIVNDKEEIVKVGSLMLASGVVVFVLSNPINKTIMLIGGLGLGTLGFASGLMGIAKIITGFTLGVLRKGKPTEK